MFLYYLSGASDGAGVEHLLEEYQLAYAFDVKPWKREVRGQTPDGKNGVLLSSSSIGMDLESQTWVEMQGRQGLPTAFLGWHELPKPADLRRPIEVRGNVLNLNGSEWTVPVVREVNVETGEAIMRLPGIVEFTDDGKRVVDVDPTLRSLWDNSEAYWHAMMAGDDIADEDCIDFCVQLFQTNYRVGLTELNKLKAWSTELGPGAIIALSIGWFSFQRWQAIQKKTMNNPAAKNPKSSSPQIANGSATSDGQTDTRPDTLQPAPI